MDVEETKRQSAAAIDGATRRKALWKCPKCIFRTVIHADTAGDGLAMLQERRTSHALGGGSDAKGCDGELFLEALVDPRADEANEEES